MARMLKNSRVTVVLVSYDLAYGSFSCSLFCPNRSMFASIRLHRMAGYVVRVVDVLFNLVVIV